MAGKLCFLVCKYFMREVVAAVEAEGFDDVRVAVSPAKCGKDSSLQWGDLDQSLRGYDDCSQVCILGGSCLAGLGDPPEGLAHYRVHRMEQCFYLFANRAVIDRHLGEGAYLLTPGWLAGWRRQIDEWGFDQALAREFFGESTSRLLLLDTGVDGRSQRHLHDFAGFVDRPFEIMPVGLDYLRLYLNKIVLEWRLAGEKSEPDAALRSARRQAADYAMSLDLLGSLTQMVTEAEVIQKILDLFTVLFAPGQLFFMPVRDGEPGEVRAGRSSPTASAGVRERLVGLDRDYAWTKSGKGFRLRVSHGRDTLGILEVDDLTFPEYKEHYLNLALTIVKVCGLAIGNARTYQHIEQSQEELRQHRDHLEELVEARTAQLVAANEQLRQEIAERKQAEERLWLSEHRFRALFEGANDAVFIVSLEGRFLAVNQRAADMLGYGIHELIGQPLTGSITPDEQQDSIHVREALLAGETLPIYERTFRRKDGTEFPVEINVSLVRDRAGKPLHVQSIVRDITERKRAEQELKTAYQRLQELDHLKDEFVASVSHELRTPIAILKLSHEVLERKPDRVAASLERARRATARLEAIVEEMLYVTQMKEELRTLTLTGVDLNTLVAQATASRMLLAEEHGLALTFDEQADLPVVQGNPILLDRVAGILLSNALGYTPAGGRVHVHTGVEGPNGQGWVFLCVSDTGPGIPPDELPRLFDRFFRGEIALQAGVPGAGLGLFIAKEIVERHNGRIEVESEGLPGKGATFTVWLPAS